MNRPRFGVKFVPSGVRVLQVCDVCGFHFVTYSGQTDCLDCVRFYRLTLAGK